MRYYYYDNIIYESYHGKVGSSDITYEDIESTIRYPLSDLWVIVLTDFKKLCSSITTARVSKNGTHLYLQGTAHIYHGIYRKNPEYIVNCTPTHISLTRSSKLLFTQPLTEYDGFDRFNHHY
jgi:hypothetical protein